MIGEQATIRELLSGIRDRTEPYTGQRQREIDCHSDAVAALALLPKAEDHLQRIASAVFLGHLSEPQGYESLRRHALETIALLGDPGAGSSLPGAPNQRGDA